MDLLIITQKLLNIQNNDIAVVPGHVALRVSVKQCILEVILFTVQYNEWIICPILDKIIKNNF